MRTITSILGIAFTTCLLAGSPVGVAAQSEGADLAAPTEFSGELKFVAKCSGTADVEFGEGVIRSRANETYCRPSVLEMSDPRFDGDWTIRENSDRYLGGPTISTSAFHVQTDDGAWSQAPGSSIMFADGSAGTQTQVFVGEGAYDGYLAVVEFAFEPGKHWNLRGVAIQGELPPAIESAPAD